MMNNTGFRRMNYSLFMWLVLLMVSCVQEPVQNGLGGYINDEEYQEQFIGIDVEEIKKDSVKMDTIQLDTSFIDFSNEMIDLLHSNKLEEFSEYFHPKKSCTFVPYTFLTNENQKFITTTFKKQLEANLVLNWGDQDGSGEPIELTISDYISQWVYDFDFKTKSTEVHINKGLAFSNTQNNLTDIFPEAHCIEFYQEGSTEYEGLDWRSLIFYVEKFEGNYVLVAVVHNQWTI